MDGLVFLFAFAFGLWIIWALFVIVGDMAERPARLNSDIVVAGYPYVGLLGGLNITRGAVSSVTGLGGDIATMQVSAPVQAGNSGGPVLDERGAVVGVVVSKLDAEVVERELGDTPQNISFAIRASLAKLFLVQNGVEPQFSTRVRALTSANLADFAKGITVLVTCNH